MLTYKFKLKGGHKKLRTMACKVNFVWNYCNETSLKAIKRDGKFLSGYDLQALTSGCSKTLNSNAQTVQAVCEEYAKSRKQAKKRRLEWRKSGGARRSLGWVPFKASGASVKEDRVTFAKQSFKFFKSRELPGKIKTGCFVEDACGDWYVCFVCEAPAIEPAPNRAVGVDLGLSSLATTSDGEVFDNPRSFYKNQELLAKAQRFGKKKRTVRIHRKITRIRKDNLHKISSSLTGSYAKIIVGNLNLAKGKATNDASFRGLIPLLEYKASRRQGEVIQVNEAYTTVTCNRCLERTGPTGLTGLSVREWVCDRCGQSHSRDVNAAINILRLGFQTPVTSGELLANQIEGIPRL